MATANPDPPPDGFYWWAPHDPASEETIVRIRHSLYRGFVTVEFLGTDATLDWGDQELDGTFTKVAPR